MILVLLLMSHGNRMRKYLTFSHQEELNLSSWLHDDHLMVFVRLSVMNPHYCKLLYRWNLFLKWAARKWQRENSTLLNTLKSKMHQQVKKKDKQKR